MQWKKAFIAPVPKISNPIAPVDYRSISVTPILSQMPEKHVVRKNLYPALIRPVSRSILDSAKIVDFSDQYTFRPILGWPLHTVNDLLLTNALVRVFALNFSKASYTVKHDTLLGNILLLDIPDEVYSWVRDFFGEHSHCTKFDGITSTLIEIQA